MSEGIVFDTRHRKVSPEDIPRTRPFGFDSAVCLDMFSKSLLFPKELELEQRARVDAIPYKPSKNNQHLKLTANTRYFFFLIIFIIFYFFICVSLSSFFCFVILLIPHSRPGEDQIQLLQKYLCQTLFRRFLP